MKLNLSDWKKVGGDAKHTQLRNKNGHELKIAHGALSPKMREQLHALPMADGGRASKDPTQQHLLPGDKLPNSIERGVVNQARAKMADGGKPNDQISGLGPDKPGSDAYKQHAAMQQGAGYPAPTPSATPDPYKMADGGVPVPGSKYPSSSGQYSDPIGPTNFQPKNVPGSKYPTSTGQYGAGTGGKAGSKAMPDDRDEPFAKGGFVNNPKLAESKKQPPRNQWSSINQQAQDDRQPIKMFADGGPSSQMPDPSDQIVQDAAAQTPDTQAQISDQQTAPTIPGATPDPFTVRKQQLYNEEANKASFPLAPFIPGAMNAVTSPSQEDLFGPNGEPPKNFNPQVAQRAMSAFTQEQDSKQKALNMGAQTDALKAQFGSSLPSPPQQQREIGAPSTGTPPINQPGADGGVDPMSLYQSSMTRGMNEQIGGVQQEAQAVGQLGRNQATVEANDAANQQAIQNTFSAQNDHIYREVNNTLDDINQDHIDPNRYWDNMSTFGKIGTALSLMISGAGAGITGGPNLAAQFLNQQIDRDIEAQKANLGKKQNLVGAYLNEFGNVKDAASMASVTQRSIAAAQLQKQADLMQDPIAKAKALQQIGSLHQQNAMIIAQLAANRALSGVAQSGGEGQFKQALALMRQFAPDKAKDAEGRYVPGIGLSDNQIPNEVRATLAAKQNLQERAADMYNWAAAHSGSLSPSDRNIGQAKAAELQSMYRQSIQGGVFKKGEQEYIDNIIDSDPTKFFNSIRVLPKLKTVIQSNNAQMNNTVKSYGIRPFGGQAPQQASQQGYTPKTARPVGK